MSRATPRTSHFMENPPCFFLRLIIFFIKISRLRGIVNAEYAKGE
nr:MAG TPA: hypothetical protein [Caudoviricetes sp.]